MKKIVYRSFVFIFVALIGSNVSAQDLRLGGIEYNYYPQVALRDGADGFNISFQEFGGFFAVPRVLKNDNFILINGLSYGFVQSKLEDTQRGTVATNSYHRISYSLSTLYRGIDDWIFMARVAPSLVSDFENKLSDDDFIVFGSLMATKKINEKVKFGGGIAYTSRLGKPLLLPLLQFSYKSERHSFNAFLPAMIQYHYTFGESEKFKAGFKVVPNGSNFNADQDHFAQVTVDKLNYVRINMGPEVSYMVTDILRLELSGGLSARRTYTYYGQEGSAYDYSSENGAFISVGLVIVPPMGRYHD